MTERQRMEAGMWYDANFDPSLAKLRLAVKDLCWQFNALAPSALEERLGLLRRIVGRLDEPAGWMSPARSSPPSWWTTAST